MIGCRFDSLSETAADSNAVTVAMLLIPVLLLWLKNAIWGGTGGAQLQDGDLSAKAVLNTNNSTCSIPFIHPFPLSVFLPHDAASLAPPARR